MIELRAVRLYSKQIQSGSVDFPWSKELAEWLDSSSPDLIEWSELELSGPIISIINHLEEVVR
jgi:hypothetical protein